MAEIKIREKKPIWPWILIGALILAAILYFAVFADDDGVDDMDDVNTEQVMDEDADEMNANNPNNDSDQYANSSGSSDQAIAKYSDYIGDSSRMGIDHEYSHGALTHLIDAVQAKANDMGVDIISDMQQAKQSADAVTADPYELHHADNIKKSGMIIVMRFQPYRNKSFLLWKMTFLK